MPQLKVDQGITAARTIFGKSCFDAEKCADGIQALRHYRYEIEEAKSDPAGGHIALNKVPRHDWASHGADAFQDRGGDDQGAGTQEGAAEAAARI
jgi:phage terminase large subunit